ncbi:MAG: phosphate ABC transporter ATP-binding protein [Chloroflexi bacterium]|nr:phosphate ABC transporter ATP-binding protein [Chloroflexota bacterium]
MPLFANGTKLSNQGHGPKDNAPIEASLQGVSLFYGSFRALKDVRLDVLARQITAIIGPSGSGKSSLLRTVNRMNEVFRDTRLEGKVLLRGEDIYAPTVDVVELRKRVGMVFQRPNPFPQSVYDNVAYGPRVHGVGDRGRLATIVEKSLRRAALWDDVKDKLYRPALELSGGQQQRLCIARVLAVEPEVILMDEPASALDPIAALKIEDLMRELREEYTVIIVTHNMQQAARVSDWTAVLMAGEDRAGTIVEFGPTRRIFTNPSDRRTEDYITGRIG